MFAGYEDTASYVDAVRRHYDDGCFACGRDNPMGLHVDDFDLADGEVTATFTPRAEYRGTDGVLHGGVTATALDEILVWAGILVERVMTVTGTLELKYRRPVPLDQTIEVAARVDERRGRRVQISGRLSVDDQPLVTGSGLYVVIAEMSELLAADHS